jgi:hypothetical protein
VTPVYKAGVFCLSVTVYKNMMQNINAFELHAFLYSVEILGLSYHFSFLSRFPVSVAQCKCLHQQQQLLVLRAFTLLCSACTACKCIGKLTLYISTYPGAKALTQKDSGGRNMYNITHQGKVHCKLIFVIFELI